MGHVFGAISIFLSGIILSGVILHLWHALKAKNRELAKSKEENESMRCELRALHEAHGEQHRQLAICRERYTALQEKLTFQEAAQAKLEEIFQRTAAEVSQKALEQLRLHSQTDMAREKTAIAAMVDPVKEVVNRLDQRIILADRHRGEETAKLDESLRQLFQSHRDLDREAKKLNMALRQSHVRGRWGELQLRRLVEMAGLQAHVDFNEQVPVSVDSSSMPLRADMVVHLPGDQHVVVDAKAVIDAYMQAMECELPAERATLLKRHAQNVFDRIVELGKREYGKHSAKSFAYVILFLPGDHLYAAALQERPNLFEEALAHHILLAAPMNLLAMLKTIACTWSQAATTREAEKIVSLGKILIERMDILFKRLGETGLRLRQAVDAYNGTVATADSRLCPTMQQFAKLQSIGGRKDILPPAHVSEMVRLPNMQKDTIGTSAKEFKI
ncbi:MAG: DNA recombination protein RmuC [Puniceicoccales bacterium]|nr:DNA recombination protein RmuC [Puniceicoccales bacterium]